MIEVISYSELAKFDTCERQYYYTFELGLRPIEQSEAIATGTKGHKLLQSFYECMKIGKSREESIEIIQHRAKDLMTSMHPVEVGSLLKAWNMVDNYIRKTDFGTKKVSLVENRFLFPAEQLDLDNPNIKHIQIGFTPDVVFERTGGWLDVEDSKFIGKAWPEAKLDHFRQNKLYYIFLKRMGYKVSRCSVKFFNTTTGKVTEKNDTITPVEESTIIRDFVRGLEEVVNYRDFPPEYKKHSRRTMNFYTCQFCAFSRPCKLEEQGKDVTNMLRNQYVKNEYDYTK